MPTKRLEYEPLKAVLQNLDPNLRIQLALRCPSIRTVEKVVPIKIKNFASGAVQIEINDTKYKVGIYRQYHIPAQTPRYHQKHNQEGGFGYDIDRWGFQTSSFDDPITDGDIDLRQGDVTWREGNPGAEQWYTEAAVIEQEVLRRLANRNGVVLEPDYIIPELRNLLNSELIISQNEGTIRSFLENNVERLQNSFAFFYCQILPYHYRRNNILPPYTPFIQLTISGPYGDFIERVEYSRKLSKAMKHLNTVLLGERHHPIQVNELSFVRDSFVHRLPKGLTIKTKRIHSESVNFERLNGLLVRDSYPLDILTIESGMEDSNNIEQEFVKSANKLVISNFSFENESWIPIVQNLRNPCIVLKYQTRLHVPQHYTDLVENWLGSERTKGTNLSIGFRQKKTAMELLDSIKSQFEVIEMSERCLTLPMGNGTRLLVSCEHVEVDTEGSRNTANFWETDEETETNWVLKLIVV